jgi:DNA-binding PadR family transcriptional regulator
VQNAQPERLPNHPATGPKRADGRGLLKSEWGISDNNRKAKFYQLTKTGQERLEEETAGWNRLVSAMRLALNTQLAKA